MHKATAIPDMPVWVRGLLILSGAAAISGAVFFSLPLSDLHWTRALVAVLVAVVGVDLVLAGVQKRWPWLLDLVLFAS